MSIYAELGALDVLFFVAPKEIVYVLFLKFFSSYILELYIWSMCHSFDQRIWFMVIFFLSMRDTFCCKCELCSVKLSYILSQFLLLWAELWNVLQPFWWGIVTRPLVLVYQFYFYICHTPSGLSFWKVYFWAKSFLR